MRYGNTAVLDIQNQQLFNAFLGLINWRIKRKISHPFMNLKQWFRRGMHGWKCLWSFNYDCDKHMSLHWRHNDHDGVSNHQPHGCLLNRLFRRRSKKTSKLRITGLCAGNSPRPVNSPHKGPVTRKMFPFDDVIMYAFIHFQTLLTFLGKYCFIKAGHISGIQRGPMIYTIWEYYASGECATIYNSMKIKIRRCLTVRWNIRGALIWSCNPRNICP